MTEKWFEPGLDYLFPAVAAAKPAPKRATFKPLTFEGRFECGFDDAVKGKIAALTAVVQPNGIGLGIAIANEQGYIPIPLYWCRGEDYEQMQEHAKALNAELFGLDAKEAAKIVCSSMFAKVRA